jgi:alpha-1,2-mannosyltransferase
MVPSVATISRRASRLHSALNRFAAPVLFGALPLLLLLYVERKIFVGSGGFGDLRVLLRAGDDVLHGTSPYPPTSTVVAHSYDYFVYPAPVALLMVPLAPLPFSVAATLFSLAMVACVVAALWIMRVRDWRCYGAAFLWFPMQLAILVGNITPLLVLGLAALWRFRDRRYLTAISLAGLIVAKLFLWPLLVWLLATRRYVAAVGAAVGAVVLALAAWAVIGFAGFSDYGDVLAKLARVEEAESFSVVAFGESVGFSQHLAQWLAMVVGGTLILVTFAVGRWRRRDSSSYTVAVVAALLLTPIAWLHFFALLLVPVALAQRRLGTLWLLPIGLWVLKTTESHTSFGSPWRIALPLATTFVILIVCVWGSGWPEVRLRGRPPEASGAS